MKILLQFTCLLLGLTSWVQASEKYPSYKPLGAKKYFYGCSRQMLSEVTICPPRNLTCQCVNENALATIAGCLRSVNKSVNAAAETMLEYCERSHAKVSPDWYETAIEYFDKYAKSPRDIPNYNRSMPVQIPIIMNKTNTELFQESFNRFYNNYDNSILYGAGLLGYWLLILLLGAMSHWTKMLFPSFTKKMTGPITNFWRANVSIPATFRVKKLQEQTFFSKYFSYLIPSRLESLVIFLFYCAVIWLHAMNSKALENDPVYLSKYNAEMRYVADRTGIIATMMMPLVFLYAGRNNFLQWLVGWNYSTFMAYHRHTARVMFALVVVHAVTFTYVLAARYAAESVMPYFIWGVVATVAAAIMLVQGMLYLRRRWYEIFLFLHIILAALYVAGTWVHVEEFGFLCLVYPAIAVWCFDRVVRIGRLIVFGFPHADVTLLADETLKVVVPKPSYWHSIPGGHAFIHFIKPTYFWQSHPFTFTESVDNKDSIVLYCKVKGGVTHSLYQSLAKAPGRTCKIRVSCEGPYGEPTPARYADTAVFIAGGNGIPGMYSEAVDIASRTKSKSNKLKLIWVIREWKSLIWFYEELLQLRNTGIETIVYVSQPTNPANIDEFKSVTRPRIKEFNKEELNLDESLVSDKLGLNDQVLQYSLTSDNDSTMQEIVNDIKTELGHIEFKEGRPDIGAIIPQELRESDGSISFVTCGNPSMVDQVRYYCSKNIFNKENKRVDFYERVQVWA